MRRNIVLYLLVLNIFAFFSCSNEREDLTAKMTDSLKITAYVLNSDLEGKGYFAYDGTREHKNNGYWVSDDGKEYTNDEVFNIERLELGKPRVLAPLGYDYRNNLNIWLDCDGVIEVDTDPLNDDRVRLAHSLDDPMNPGLGTKWIVENAFRALPPFAVNVCPIGEFTNATEIVLQDTLTDREYFINVRTYDLDGTQVITAKLKLTVLPDDEYPYTEVKSRYGQNQERSRFLSIELIEYDYSEVYKLDEYYESR